MTLKAIYSNGVFKPAEPVSLAEGTEVEVVVSEASRQSSKRVAGLADFFKQVAQTPAPTQSTPFSNRDHDRVLYDRKSKS